MADITWLVVASALVFVMQGGFLCLEAGLTRTKNSINVAVKNVTDFGVSLLIFWAFGFALMFGVSAGGWVGWTDFMPASVGAGADPFAGVFFLFQAMFCGTAVTIMSGAVAERVRFGAYLLMAVVVSALIYPVFGHWAWGGGEGGPAGWLKAMGFVDFAGSTVVHSVGGWAALAGVIVIGARTGRFADGKPAREVPSNNLPVAMLGVMLLWFGWIGFNGGSTLALNDQIPGILLNTMLAAAAGLVCSLVLGRAVAGYTHPSSVINGTLAGLVAITANCHCVTALAAIAIGAIGAVVTHLASRAMVKLRLDDAVDAAPVHLAAGAWGTLAVAIFGDPAILGTGLTPGAQLAVQALGVAACGVLTFAVAFTTLAVANRITPLRVTAEDEAMGLNVAEHRASTELLDFVSVIERQSRTHDLSLRAPVEPFTEVGQIARHYNALMDGLQQSKFDIDEFRRMASNTPGMMFQYVLRPDGSTHFPFVSDECRALYGLDPDDVRADASLIMRATHHDDRDSLERTITESARQLAPFRWEGRIRHTSGAVKWIKGGARPQVRPGGAVLWDGLFMDITALKEAEAKMTEARDVAERANSAKSEFLANMSHEIRTPLHGILSFAGFGIRKAAKGDAGKLGEYFEKIDTSGRRLLLLVNDLLDIAKLEAGKMRYEFAESDLTVAVTNVVDEMSSLLSNRKLKVRFKRPDAPIRGVFDQLKVMQVIRNLLNNAAKFSPEGAPIDIELTRAGDTARITVRDRGCGVPEAELDDIFDKFIQSTKTKSGSGGTGLGLAICREIIVGHGGEISAANNPDGGAAFSFTVPLTRPDETPAPEHAPVDTDDALAPAGVTPVDAAGPDSMWADDAAVNAPAEPGRPTL